MRKLRALSAARFSVDVTSLVTADPDHQTISDQGWLLSARSRIGMALDDADTRLALCCFKLVLYARHNLCDEFAALCNEVVWW